MNQCSHVWNMGMTVCRHIKTSIYIHIKQGKCVWASIHAHTNTNTGAHTLFIAPMLPQSKTEDVWLVWSLTPAVASFDNSSLCNRWSIYCDREHTWIGSRLWVASGCLDQTDGSPKKIKLVCIVTTFQPTCDSNAASKAISASLDLRVLL